MGLFNKQIIDYTKQVLLTRSTRSQVGFALYPQNTTGTSLSVNVTSTTVVITYVSSSVQTTTITYTGISVEDLCLAINRAGYPIKAVATISNTILNSGDLITTGTGKSIPEGFTIHDRTDNSGVFIRTKRVSVRQKSSSQIRVVQPYLDTATLPWYPRIQVGSFAQKINGRVFYFSVPEYDNQVWSLKYGKPFKDVFTETPTQYSETAVVLKRTPLFWNGDNIALFNGSAPISTAQIEDVDIYNGIVYFKSSINASEITVNYTYKEDTYEYRDININCHFHQNPLLIGKVVLLYILPSSGVGIASRKRTVFHVVSNSIQEAIDSIRLDDETVPMAILGAYSIQQVYGSDNAKILDTRVLGGGLKDAKGPTSPVHEHDDLIDPEETSVKIETVYSEANSYWDIGRWDGETYPGAAAVLIDLPSDLKEYLPLQDIKAKATKFLAAGVTPLFEFSDRELPDVEQWSRQVSTFTGTLSISGNQMLPINYTLPGAFLDSSWPEEYERNLPLHTVDNNVTIIPTSLSGICVPYLKSTPIAGVEWEERYYQLNTNSSTEYSPWKKVRWFDKKVVDNHGLIKNYLVFDNTKLGIQYRNIKINSPFQTVKVDRLKRDISDALHAVSVINHIRAGKIDDTPIKYDIPDIMDTGNLVATTPYIGYNPAYTYLFDYARSDQFLSVASAFYNKYLNYLTSISYGTDKIQQYNPSTQQYEHLPTGTTGIQLCDIVSTQADFVLALKDFIGYDNLFYPLSKAILANFLTSVVSPTYKDIIPEGIYTSINRYYYPSVDYTYTDSGYMGTPLNLAEVYNYGFADIHPSFEDHRYLKSNIALCKSAGAFQYRSDFTAFEDLYQTHQYLIGSNYTFEEIEPGRTEIYSGVSSPYMSSRYTATYSGINVPVYGYTRILTNQLSTLAYSGTSMETPWIVVGTSEDTVNLVIRGTGIITGAVVYPNTAAVYNVNSGVLSLSMYKNKRARVEINNDLVNALHIFTNPLEEAIPENAVTYNGQSYVPSGTTLYFPPGQIYNLGMLYKVYSDSTVIIPGGSVVIGSFDLTNTSGVSFKGNGTVVGDYAPDPDYVLREVVLYDDKLRYAMFYAPEVSGESLQIDNSIEGLTLVNSPFYTFANKAFSLVKNVQVLNPWAYNNDGFHVTQDPVTRVGIIKDSYAFVGDDCLVVIPGAGRNFVDNCFLTTTHGTNIQLCYFGAPNASLTQITNCDLFNFTIAPPDATSLQIAHVVAWLDGRSGDETVSNVIIKDTTVWTTGQVRLVDFSNLSYPFNDAGFNYSGAMLGNVFDIEITNMYVPYRPIVYSLLSGLDTGNTPHDITFTDLRIAGVTLDADNYTGYFNLSSSVYNVNFLSSVTDATPVEPISYIPRGLDYKLPRAFNTTITNSGLPVVNTWFTAHDRLGEYAGTIGRDLTICYDNLRLAHIGVESDKIYDSAGFDIYSLDDYFKATAYLLHQAKTALLPILNYGGHLNREVANLIYTYGWFVNTYPEHYKVGPFNKIPDCRSEFTEIYNLGVDVLIKSMITTNGEIQETDYIDYTPGPFVAYPASLIFNTLIPGLTLDYDSYACKAAAVFNTLQNCCYVTGAYYQDPRKLSTKAGGEVAVSQELARLYRYL